MLASEAGDIELEIIDLLRKNVRETIGDVAFGDAWKIERLSSTQLLIKPGEAWKDGLPVIMRGGKDQLVSGAVLDTGILPLGVTITDDASGEGKVLTFGTTSAPNNGDITPTQNYRVVIEVSEQSITDVQDPFLRNANLTESTAQKVRLVYRINIVPESAQDLSPEPYTDENSNPPNLQNEVIVNPSVGSGDVVSITPLSGAEVLDGRNLDVVINNPDALLPVGLNAQQPFSNGTLVDSVGNSFHINQIFNDTVSGRVVLRIDKEFQQLDPEVIVGVPYTVKKGPVYNTNDDGNFIGRMFMPLATVDFDDDGGVEHSSSIIDLLTRVQKVQDFQVEVADKFDLRLADGGNITWELADNELSWIADFAIINPSGPEQVIETGSSKLLEGGSLVYTLNYSGGIISRGNTAINITTGGTTITIDPITFADLRVGNVVEDVNGDLTFIVGVLPSTNQIVVDSAMAAGAGSIYLDSFATALAPRSLRDFVLAVRKGDKIYISALELEDGETSQIGDGISTQLLAFIGATGEADDSPNYPSNFYVTDGESLVTSIGALDAALDAIQGSLDTISWKAPVADEASLPAVGNSDGDVRLVLDTKIAYAWDDALGEWILISGSGGGFKATFYDPIATALPTGPTATFDGVAVANGDTVLFSNLAVDNNRVYEVSGVGSSMVWDDVRAFNGQLDPEAGDTVRFQDGEAFAGQLAVFDGTEFKVNDVIRFFDGVSANFWEQSSIKSTQLNNDQVAPTDPIFTISSTGSENIIVDYSIIRNTTKRTGSLYLTSDGTVVNTSDVSAYIGDTGVTFESFIDTGNIVLAYTSTDTGEQPSIKYTVKRWSDGPGGPTGIPNYTSSSSSSTVLAAGSPGQIQYHGSGGNLAAESRFVWDSSLGALNLNGLKVKVLQPSITLSDNQPTPQTLLSYPISTNNFTVIEYSIQRDANYRVGRLLVAASGSSVEISDDFTEVGTAGTTFSAAIVGTDVVISYQTTSTGFSGTFKHSRRQWQ